MRGTILVVEDDVDLTEIYKEILEMHEFDVETATNGRDGVKKFIEFKPYLVIMDDDLLALAKKYNQIRVK